MATKKLPAKKNDVKKTVKAKHKVAVKKTMLKKTAKKLAPKNIVSAPPKISVHHIETTQNAVSPNDGKIHFHMQRLFWWGGLSLVVLAALAILSQYSTQVNRDKLLPAKLAEVSVLSAENDVSPVPSKQAVEEITVPSIKPVNIIFVGDIMLARYVERKMRGNQDYTWPYHDTAEFLQNADITFGNLETPLLAGRNTDDNSFVFRADPSAAKGLAAAGFDVLSVANNHVMNYKEYGLQTTLKALHENNIAPVGGGNNVDEAHTPVIKEINGQRIAFYAYVDNKIPPGYQGVTFGNVPGMAAMEIEAVKNDVKNALKSADIVIVSMHAGNEYRKTPTDFQKEFAHAAIDAGATIVVGAHPHVVQPIEWYGNGVIFYSLGNFVFDQFFNEDVKTGLVAKVAIEKGKKPVVELFPSRSETVQTKIYTEEPQRSNFLERLGHK